MNDHDYEANSLPESEEEVPVWQQILKLVAGVMLAIVLGAVLGRLFFYFTIEQPGRTLQDSQEVGRNQWWESRFSGLVEEEGVGEDPDESF